MNAQPLSPTRVTSPFIALAVAFVAALVLLFASGCAEGDFRPRATGLEEQITVVMDSNSWKGPLGEAVRQNLAPPIETLPQGERYFDLRQVDLTSTGVYDRLQSMKNVVFVAPLSDSTNEANYLRQRLSDQARDAVMNGQPAVVPREDLWRQSQMIYYVTAADEQGLISALQNQGSQIREGFKEITLDRMQREMFEKERQFNLEDTLMARHGFAVNVQHDYQIAPIEGENVVWLRRLLTDTRRELMIYYEENADPSTLTPEWIYNTQDSLMEKYMQGNVAGFLQIDYRRPLNTEQISFLGRYGYETRGLWHMVGRDSTGSLYELGQGGPFVKYTFYDQATDRIYMIDGMVFAPGYDKRAFTRHMEIIAHTFRTQAEVDSTQQTLAAGSE